MVAIIKPGQSIRRVFYYNENKLSAFFINDKGEKKPCATLLMAGNYPMDLEQTREKHRLNMLLKTAEKRPSVTSPSLHISLNFAPKEEHPETLLKQIAAEYMDAIGLGEQPYLVYQHHDAGHPHMHIVTLRVRPDGTTIDTYNIGKKKSEPAREKLEEKYNLVRAKDHKRNVFRLPAVNVGKVLYGKSETKKSITNVLDWVLTRYKYSSLAALNALLKGYNICADRGAEQSRIFIKKGLLYRLLDAEGKPVGVPIPASHIYSKPTLKKLEEHFQSCPAFTPKERARVKNAIDLHLKKIPDSNLDLLEKALLKQNIRMVLRTNAQGQIYGITYVDHTSKCILNGSDLGKAYSANAIQNRCKNPRTIQKAAFPTVATSGESYSSSESHTDSLFELLMQPENVYEPLPYQLKRRKKRKK
ncbi:relaxase/mobilization nuclease domain-containing protein [Chitinophaga sp. MM2321]|uniref:relaxase/mobilization nuclease domain-containing protein n=1 Tax=Chitinophaga sp. MM2321 TaxID=3137178 RepID=UPI0032D5936A